MSYIKIIYIFLYFPFSLIQKKGKPQAPARPTGPASAERSPPAGQAQPTNARAGLPQRPMPEPPCPRSPVAPLPLSVSLTAGPALIPNPSLTKPNQSTSRARRRSDLPGIVIPRRPLAQDYAL